MVTARAQKVIIDGNTVVENGEVPKVDQKKLAKEANEVNQR